jgi:hypothetical protein
MHSDWFNGIEILQGRWQHGEKMGYCYPSGLEMNLCKWDIYVPLVTEGLTSLTIKVTSVEHEVPHSQVALSYDTQTFPNRCCLSCCVMLSVSIISITDNNDSYFYTHWQNCEK